MELWGPYKWPYKLVFPKTGVSQNEWFTMENPIKIDDLGVPLFLETPKCVPGDKNLLIGVTTPFITGRGPTL